MGRMGAFLVCVAAGCNASLVAGDDAGTRTDLAPRSIVDPERPEASLPDMAGGPPYPIVLVHGMAGFRNIGPLEYFYGVPEALRKDGHDVWISQQDPLNTSEVRGPQLRAFVETVLATTGKAKVNLVGHSHGGFDVRFVASQIGDRVASATMIASPMGGDPIADIAQGIVPGPAQDALGALLDLYGVALGGYNSDIKAELANLTSPGAAAFFARHPDDPRVAYYSIAGRSNNAPGDTDCQTSTPAPFVSRWNESRDPLNVLLLIPGAMLDGLNPRPTHDGLVPVGSARHGTFLGCIPADHLDEVGQIAGQAPGSGNPFDHVLFYRDLADWLVEQGY